MKPANNTDTIRQVVGLSVLALALLAAFFFIHTTHGARAVIPAPTNFIPYTASDNGFVCEQPVGWETTSAGSGDIESAVTFQKGSAEVDVSSSLTGSLWGDINKAGSTRPVVEERHAAGEAPLAKKLQNYQEQPFQTFNTSLGEVCCSEFTSGDGDATDQIRGYRATMMSNERCIQVVCMCPQTNWKTLEPTFQRIIRSVHG